MVRFALLALLPVVAFSVYPSLSHPPIFLFSDGFVILDVQTSTPSTLNVFVKTEEDGFLAVDPVSTRHRIRIPVKEDFDYALKIGSDVLSGHVVFPSDKLKKARILIYGDTRNDGSVQDRIISFGKRMGADFLIHLGDIAFTDLDDTDWSRFFHSVSEFGKVVFTVQGNHETPGLRYRDYLYPPFYSFDIGKIHFVVVDGGTFPGVIRREIERLVVPGVENVLLVHEPFYTCSRHSSDPFVILQKKLAEILPSYGIHLVISSHDHNYQRIERNFVQLVIGGGGAPLCSTERCDGLKRSYDGYSFAMMYINGKDLKIVVYDLDGNVLDELAVGG